MSDRFFTHVRLEARKKQRENSEAIATGFAAAPTESTGFLAGLPFVLLLCSWLFLEACM